MGYRLIALTLTVLLGHSASSPAQSRDQKVRQDKRKIEAEGLWIYNDFPKAQAQAKSTGKPIMAVLRCLPCEECVKLDDEVIRQEPTIQKHLNSFVRLRLVSTNGLDLSIFQFDTDQSFAIFFPRGRRFHPGALWHSQPQHRLAWRCISRRLGQGHDFGPKNPCQLPC